MAQNDTTAWTAFLTGLEQEVKSAHRAMDEGRPINGALIEPWSPPKTLGALPIELLDRAQLVNDSLNQLEVRAANGQLLLRKEINRVGELKAKAHLSSKKSQYAESVIPKYVDRSV